MFDACLHRAVLWAADPPAQPGISGWLVFLIVVAAFVLPFVLGALLAQVLKLKEFSNRIGVVLLAIVLGVAPFAFQRMHTDSWKEAIITAIPLGIDLAGGTNMVFQARSDDPDKPITSQVMDQMVAAVARRINPAGTEEITVRQVGADRIEVIVPGADPDKVEETKKRITKLGSLEFAILANLQDHRPVIERAQQLPQEEDVLRVGGRVQAAWRPVGSDSEGHPKEIGEHEQVVTRTVTRRGKQIQQFLVMFEPESERITGKYLTRAYPTTDENGQPAVGFVLNTRGGYLFQRLTSRNRPRPEDGFQRRLAVLLDDEIHSAPVLKDVISNSGQISGRFTRKEIDELISVLNAGALVVPIDEVPISEFSISPLLGHDVQEKGIQAILLAGVAVLAFMLVYYRFAGAVADVCLVLNLILVLGTMVFIDATFTLPGLAGLVLTIGMAVDSNVLIYERIREERQRGSSLRMSIHNGFSRAFTTIVDANVTTLITAVILYMIGTDQVRGFAVTLFIGIVASMFTAIYFGRLVFDIAERKRWITELRMLSLVKATRWDFVGKRRVAFVLSAAVILGGLGAFIVRGEDNLDIDFSGGTMVTFEVAERPGQPPPDPGTIQGILSRQPELGTAISLERLQTLEELEKGVTDTGRFRLRTKTQDVALVQRTIDKALSEQGYPLHKVTMAAVAPEDIKPLRVETDGDQGGSGADENTEASGYEVPLAFKSAIKTSTAARYLAEALEQLTSDEGQPKYEDAATLFEIEGTVPTEGAATFTAMRVRTRPELAREDLVAALAAMQNRMAVSPIFEELTTFASAVASEMRWTAATAILFSMLAIMAYIWFRFKNLTFGVAVVVALVHDVLVVLGCVALGAYLSRTGLQGPLMLEDFKINLPMIAAFLTIIGYSLNDTIVVFDRVREIRGKNPALTGEMINLSLNQTLARTLLTSLTTLIVVVILYAVGGEGIHGFAYCLVIGVITGTYSTIYIAAPALVWMMNRGARAPARPAAAVPEPSAAVRA